MKKLILIAFLLNLNSYAQQWDWAVTADSVSGNQQTKMITKNNTVLYALIYQDGSSVINNTRLDSGIAVVKINLNGQLVWAKHYSANIQSLYAESNGNIYFIGIFSDTLNFLGTPLISRGGKDIFYGELDATGNKLWVNSAGSLSNDVGNDIISDSQGNVFVAVHLTDDYYVGNQFYGGNSALYTYLLRCDLNGNYLDSYKDSISNNNTGLKFKKDTAGIIYLSSLYDSSPCPYICGGTHVIRIDPFNYSLLSVGEFYAYSFQYLHSWAINNNSTLCANFNTGSHYYISYDIFNVAPGNIRTLRKGLGYGYDGKFTPCITKGIGDEIIIGGYFNRGWGGGYDTLWYDNFAIIPDTLPNVIIGGIDTSNQFTWVLQSKGAGSSALSDVASDGQGRVYCTGTYNGSNNWGSVYDTLPKSITFGNTILSAENHNIRFFVAGASTTVASVAASQSISPYLSVFPNPSSGVFTISFNAKSAAKLSVYNLLGNCVVDKIYLKNNNEQIDLSGESKGVYFVEITTQEKKIIRKIILE